LEESVSDKKKETISNQAALRNACLACLKRIDETLPYTDSGMVLTGLCTHIKETLQNALKEPPRNCDRFDDRYIVDEFEKQMDKPQSKTADEQDEFMKENWYLFCKWLFFEATEGGK
jgi:hypothetical protein